MGASRNAINDPALVLSTFKSDSPNRLIAVYLKNSILSPGVGYVPRVILAFFAVFVNFS